MVVAATAAGAAEPRELLVHGNGWSFSVREPGGWQGDLGPADRGDANVVFHPQGRSVDDASAPLIRVRVDAKTDDDVGEDLESDMERHRARDPSVRFEDLLVEHGSYESAAALFFVPGQLCEYVVHANPGETARWIFAASLRVPKRRATADELEAFRAVVRSLSLLEGTTGWKSPPVVREERSVVVDGVAETWRLEWLRRPTEVCSPEGIGWISCPCKGFEFGEAGELDLVRLRDSREIDRLHLTPLFHEGHGDTPPGAWEHGSAVLRRWPVLESDGDECLRADTAEVRYREGAAMAAFGARVRQRELVHILEIGDFNRDGWATEFVLHISNLPCAKLESVLVGLSPDRRKLHVFETAERPQEPLVLYVEQWNALRSAREPLRLEMWSCGDHGSEVQRELEVRIDGRGVHATAETFTCQGKLLSREVR